jgi:hypothetical protein
MDTTALAAPIREISGPAFLFLLIPLFLLTSFLISLVTTSLAEWHRVHRHFVSGASGLPPGPNSSMVQAFQKRWDTHRIQLEWVNGDYGPVFWYQRSGMHVRILPNLNKSYKSSQPCLKNVYI